jgi:ribonuclease BN (tRNA processing enzyme)
MNIRMLLFYVMAAVVIGFWGLTCVAYRYDEIAAGVRPLEPRQFDGLTLVTAGTGGAWENPLRLGPTLVVGVGERVALVDAGRGTAEALRAAEIPLSQPAAVYLTSLRPENTVGLDDLLLTSWLAGRHERLRVYGPPGTAALCAGLEAAHAGGIRARAEALALPLEAARFDATEVAEPVDGENQGLRVRGHPLPGGPLAALAWRFDAGGRGLVIAPTAWGDDTLAEFARGAHTLVRSAAYAPSPDEAKRAGIEMPDEQLIREATLHTPFRRVGAVARQAGIETLVLVRLRPPPVFDLQITSIVSNQFDGAIVIADDGDEISP